MRIKHHIVIALAAGFAVLACEKAPQDNGTSVKSVVVTPSRTTLFPLETLRLRASVTPSTATDKTVVWRSDNPEVATVEDGLVTALSVGQANIIATAGGVDGMCRLRVTERVIPVIEVSSVSISPSSLSLVYGENGNLTAAVLPVNATYPSLTWESSDPSVVTVNESGQVTTVHAGEARITATAANGTQGTCDVVVTPFPAFSVEYMDRRTGNWADASAGIFGYPGDQVHVRTTVLRDDGGVSFAIDEPSHASYADGKLFLYAPGEAVLTATGDKGYSVDIPLGCNLSDVIYWGDEPRGISSTFIMDRYSSGSLAITYSDSVGLLPVPASDYVLEVDDAALLTLTRGEDRWNLQAGSKKGTGVMRLKMGNWVDKNLCTVIVADNVPSGDNEPLEEKEIDVDG